VKSTVAIRTERRQPGGGPNDSLAVLSVRDSGPGVTEQDRDRIFEEFYRRPVRRRSR
jgi:signal transduction histidine kinase